MKERTESPESDPIRFRIQPRHQAVKMTSKVSSHPSSILFSPKSTSQRCHRKVQVGKDQEKAQSEKDSHSKNRGGKKTKLTIRYLYHINIS